ncbi:MAG: LCP family protein [Anaerolineae bacterium]
MTETATASEVISTTGVLTQTIVLTSTEQTAITMTVAPITDPVAAGTHPLRETQNILLIGTDQRDLGVLGNTDTIMVLAIDKANQRAALISFPRDLYLPIPGIGYSRINTAYPFGEDRKEGGGIPLLMSTIERNFGIPVERYIRVDFSGFKGIIDALGGIDVTVDCALTDELMPRYFGVYTLEAGEYHMNGEQALYYARSRKTTDDFDRARRQQRVMVAVRNRVLSANLIPRIPALWLAVRDVVDTNLEAGEILDLARLGATFDGKDLKGMVIRYPLVSDWTTPQGGMVQWPDMVAINKALDNIWARAPMQQTSTEERMCK